MPDSPRTDDAAECVVLVDDRDVAIGTGEKLAVHRTGVLHRAFSIVLLNSHGELLLQQRAKSKYHSPGLWSNACCGHPRPGEDTLSAASRRLGEELGIECKLTRRCGFTYRARVDKNLIEHEYDHVFVGVFDGEPKPNSDEVMHWSWTSPDAVVRDIAEQPHLYTIWLPLVLTHALGRTTSPRSPFDSQSGRRQRTVMGRLLTPVE